MLGYYTNRETDRHILHLVDSPTTLESSNDAPPGPHPTSTTPTLPERSLSRTRSTNCAHLRVMQSAVTSERGHEEAESDANLSQRSKKKQGGAFDATLETVKHKVARTVSWMDVTLQ